MLDIAVGLLVGVPAVVLLFLASTVFFDVVHWILHRMLASRWALVRAVAWPHGIHHRWIDRRLRVNRRYRTANVWCHLVLEYVTQLTFAALLALVIPAWLAIGLAGMQTVVFLVLLRERGLDLNHRARPVVEVAEPAVYCPVAYHALHHAFPDAFFSSYVKVVDVVLGTAIDLRSLRIGLVGSSSPFGRSMGRRLRRAGVRDLVELRAPDDRVDIDVLVLCEPPADLAAQVESFLGANGGRQLPPEVWAVLESPSDAIARYYYRDRRCLFRPIVLPPDSMGDAPCVDRAARSALRWIVRGAHLPRTKGLYPSLRAWKGVPARIPEGATPIPSRSEALGGAPMHAAQA